MFIVGPYVGGCVSLCFLSSFLLLRIRYARYFMATWWMFFNFLNICYGGTCKFASSSMLCEWMEPQNFAVMIMSGFVL